MSSDADGEVDIIDSLAAAEAVQRRLVNDGLARAHRAGALLNVAGWLLFVVIALGGAWLAMAFKRRVNLPLAVAGALLLLMLVFGAGVQGSAMSSADDAVAGPLTIADLAAQARSAGYDARSQESLTLINRGNGQANEARWVTAANTARNALDRLCDLRSTGCNLRSDFVVYANAHVALRTIDDGGGWEAAVAAVRSSDAAPAEADVTGQFDVFAADSETLVAASSADAAQGFADAGSGLGGLRIVVFLAGLTIAALAIFGYGQRTREYR